MNANERSRQEDDLRFRTVTEPMKACPGCAHDMGFALRAEPTLHRCADCGGYVGEISEATARTLYRPTFATANHLDALRYIDFSYPDGHRFHGWIETTPERGRIVQAG